MGRPIKSTEPRSDQPAQRRRRFERGRPLNPTYFPGEQRYVLCPSSDHLHGPLAARVFPTVNEQVPRFYCGCQANGFLGGFDHEVHGYTLAQLQQRQIRTEGVMVATRKPPQDPGARYVICPLSYFEHGGLHGVLVRKGKVRFFCRCTCRSNWFMPREWTKRLGYTLNELVAMGATEGR